MDSPILPTTLIRETSLTRWFRERHGVDLLLAAECFQRTGSFKFRAAWNLAASVDSPHILAASSGNFGQALACACHLLGKRCTVVMPDDSARVKVEAVRSWGATADLVDVRRVSRADRIAQLAAEFPQALVASAYDDDRVIEGNATLGRELAPLGLDAVIAPVGGGGLTSGLIVGLRSAGSAALVWGAEPQEANDAARSLREGTIVAHPEEPKTVADGARTVSLGRRNFEILAAGLAGIVEVPESRILEGLRRLFTEAQVKAEPTGALAVGALLQKPDLFAGKTVAAVVSGANVDPERFLDLFEGRG